MNINLSSLYLLTGNCLATYLAVIVMEGVERGLIVGAQR
jgi:hypothetical protein